MKRLPTEEEIIELCEKCNWLWTRIFNTYGYLITGPSHEQIFLPASGRCESDNVQPKDINKEGFYWSSSRNAKYQDDARCLIFDRYAHDYANSLINSRHHIRLVSDTEGIDLGLSVCWLGYNVGASMYFEKGNYFTWEEAMKQFNKNNDMDTEEQTITINVPKGKKAVYNDKTQTIEFVDIPPKRSMDWDEYCVKHENEEGFFLSDGSVLYSKAPYRTFYANVFKSKEDAVGLLAYNQLKHLRDEWTEGWNPSEIDVKYVIAMTFDYSKPVISAYNSLTSPLSFPTRDMAEEFIATFSPYIVKAAKYI